MELCVVSEIIKNFINGINAKNCNENIKKINMVSISIMVVQKIYTAIRLIIKNTILKD